MWKKTILSVAAGVIAHCAVVTIAAELPREKDQWIEVTTDHFSFYSNAGERTTRAIVNDLEELRAVLVRISNLDENSPLPVSVYIFKNDRSFTPYKNLYNGRPAASTGYFLQRDHGNYIAIDGGSKSVPSGVVYHEFVHYFASTNLPALPLWFEEGLAEVYQTFEISGGKARIGIPIVNHIYRLRTSPTLSFEELFAVDHGSPVYNEEDRKGTFYSQSWALVHYLLIGNEQRRRETETYVALLHDGISHDEAFDRAYSTDFDALELELSRYLTRKIFPILEISVSGVTETTMGIRDMSHSEVLYRLGDLLMQQERPRSEVIDHFQASLKFDPTNGQTLGALGLLAEDRAQWDQARQYYDRAIKAAPANPSVLYRSGSFLLRRGDDMERARDILRESTRLDPGFAPAWVALTGSYMAAGDYSPAALEAAETAHSLLPSRTDVAASLLRQYLHNDRREDAVKLTRRSFTSDPADSRLSWGIIARDDLERAREMLRLGRLDHAQEALADAELAARQTADPDLLLSRIQTVRSNIVEMRVTSRYNQAVTAFNTGDVTAARAILVDLSDEELPGRHADAVRSFVEFIDNPDSPAQFPAPDPWPTEVNRSEIDHLNDLISSNRLDEALQVLADFKRRGASGEPSWVDAKMDEIRLIVDHNRFAEVYNQAISQFNGGAYAAAVDTLEQLLADQPDAAEADAARRLLADARSRL